MRRCAARWRRCRTSGRVPDRPGRGHRAAAGASARRGKGDGRGVTHVQSTGARRDSFPCAATNSVPPGPPATAARARGARRGDSCSGSQSLQQRNPVPESPASGAIRPAKSHRATSAEPAPPGATHRVIPALSEYSHASVHSDVSPLIP